jgi:GntR family transcriptional regulator
VRRDGSAAARDRFGPGAAADPTSPVPLYSQIETDLRRRIRSGELGAGMAVPPEYALSRIYGVSRHTVRTALGRLEGDGLIERGAGRGTFVRPQGERIRFYLDRSFTQQMAELGYGSRSRVLSVEASTVAPEDPSPLRARIGATCLRLSRLRFGGDEPIGVQHTTVLTRLCPGLERHDFERESLYEVLSREYQLVVREIQHTIGAALADEARAELLEIRPGAPLLVVGTTALLERREILEYTTSFYRADRYEYSTRHVF